MIQHLSQEQYAQIQNHPLFNTFSAQELEQFLTKCQLDHYKKYDIILQKESSREGLTLLLEGMVEIYVHSSSIAQEEVLDVLQKGGLIGLSSLANFLGEPREHLAEHHVSVKAIEDTVCLSIPFAVLETLWLNEQVRDYILRQIATRLRDVYSSLAEQIHLANQLGESDVFIRRIQDLMSSPVIVSHDTPIYEVAHYMMSKSISSVIIVRDSKLVGLITKSDLVKRLILAEDACQQTGESVEKFMTKNPYAISRYAYYYEALSLFLANRIKHLPVVDGEQVVGMVTLSDLMRKKNRGLLEILQSIEEASFENLAEIKQAIYFVLATLLNDGIPINQTLEVITKLYDRLVKHCIDLALEKLNQAGVKKPNVHFCWFQMGSAGRKEQFILTDQDHFLVYENISHLDEQEQAQIEEYFDLLTNEVVRHLEESGFSLCPGNMMASNPEWRGSLDTWNNRLRRWRLRATNDNLLLAQNFFSFRYLYGHDPLYQQFLNLVREELSHARVFFYRLAALEKENSVPILDQPIRSLFRMERKNIEIKKEALFPLQHSLQILSFQHDIIQGTPLERIKDLEEKNAFSASFADDLLFAHASLLKIRVEQGWSHYQRGEKSSSVISLTHLSSSQKEELIHALKIVRSLQNQVVGSFGL